MQDKKNAFANSMLTNLLDISYNYRNEHSRNTNYVTEILTGSDASPSSGQYKWQTEVKLGVSVLKKRYILIMQH